MTNYNRVILVGRLTKAPELKYGTSGTAVAKFTLAINRKFNREETDWIDCVCFRQQAEYVSNYGDKGRLIVVEGRLQTRTYETQDGQKRKVTEVVVDEVEFLSPKGSGQSANKDSGGWEELGKSVNLEDIDISGGDDSEIPF